MKNRIYILLAMLLTTCQLMAQNELFLSQEIFSRINKNPAATGNSDDIDLFLHGRIQWAGVDNGPKTTVLNVTDYEEKLKSGFGLTASFDCMGVAHYATNAKFVYAYQIDLNRRTILSMGLSAGLNVVSIDYARNTPSEKLQNVELGKELGVSPDMDFGIELSQPVWTLGVSMTHLLNKETTTFKSGRHLYGYVTTLIPLGEKFDLSPTVSYMYHDKMHVLEVGTLAYFNRFIWGGVAWRPDLKSKVDPSMMAITAGFELKKFRFGYSFDLGLGKNNHLPSNTHEVILSYGITKKSKKVN